MHLTSQTQNQILSFAQKHQLIAIGEIHGAIENPEVVLEVYNLLKNKYKIVLGFEYPQSLIDNPSLKDEDFLVDGRYSTFHQQLLEKLISDKVEMFGFDIAKEEWRKTNENNLSWRDSLMAEKINQKLSALSVDQKMLIICGDAHFQTLETMVGHTNSDGVKVLEKFFPMGSKISVNSLLALHLRYQSGQVFNHKIKEVQPITLTKEHMFRLADDLIEIDIEEAHPIK